MPLISVLKNNKASHYWVQLQIMKKDRILFRTVYILYLTLYFKRNKAHIRKVFVHYRILSYIIVLFHVFSLKRLPKLKQYEY